MLTSPLSMTATQNINQEAMQAVDSWFETGVLPRHDHLATWLAVQMDLDLGGGGIHVESIDGPTAQQASSFNICVVLMFCS